MQILLTSAGLKNPTIKDFFVNQCGPFTHKKACLIFTIREQSDWQYLSQYDDELASIDLPYDHINISHDTDLSHIPDYDVYYVCGGNTFYILDRLRKTHLDQVIIRAIKDGKTYIGLSAGAIIAGPDIDIAGISGGDHNDIDLQDTRGFGLVPFHTTPHFIPQEKNDIILLQKRKNAPVIAITDDQAIFVTEKCAQLIGEQEGGLSIGYDLT